MTPPRVAARGMAVGGRFRGASGTPPPTGCPGTGGSGSLPLIRPCGATFPQGGRQGLLLAAAGGRGGVGAPRPTYGDMETPAGFTRTPVSGPPHGRGRACPARGLRGHPSMVRSVGRGLDPSAGGCPGDGCWREVSRGVGDAAPYGLPGDGRQRKPAPHPALRGHLPPRGKARAVVGGSASLRGASGTPPLRFAREWAAAGGRGGVGAPRPTYGGIWKRCGVYVSSRFRAAAR